ncbi:MAG: response regulator [Treponema sp.]|nr:response regulator [Treponema sp.]
MSNNKILIIDDEKMNIMALAQFLKPEFEIIIAADGQSGIEAAEKHIPDLILLDIIMPDISGFEVISKLKDSKLTSKIPVIFVTGLTSSDNEEKGLSLGAADYITKPFNKFIVKKRVETQFKLLEYEHLIENLKKQP